MAIPSFTEDMDIISALGDRPNTDDGLTPSQLKAKFDLAGNKIKTYINTVLIPRLLEKPSFSGIVKSNSGNFVQAVSGTDYQAPLVAGTDYLTPAGAAATYQTKLTAGTDYLTPAGAAATYEPKLSDDQKRHIFVQSSTPSGAQNGDIWVVI